MHFTHQNITIALGLLMMGAFISGCAGSSKLKTSRKAQKTAKAKKAGKNTKLHIVNGRYISTTDSLAGIEIKNDTYIMFYKGLKTDSSDYFNMTISNKIALRDTVLSKGTYLILKNKTLTLKYAILQWNPKAISLIYLPRGNYLNYVREYKK